MKTIVAKDAGYCFGVRDAVNMAYDAARKHGAVYMLGAIVHNEQVVDDLEKAGARIVTDLDDIPPGSPVLFRAHGTTREVWNAAHERGMNIIDATCPLVHEIHGEVRKLAENERQIVIIGDHGHDEVMAIANQVNGSIVVANPDEAADLRKMKRIGVVSQSTQTIENVQAIVNVLMTKVFDLHFVNTICFPTKRNQEQIKMLADMTDVMIIIGSFTSANSKRLAQLAQERNKSSYQVTCVNELEPIWFKGKETVGISAGASTPDYLIEDVKQRIEKM